MPDTKIRTLLAQFPTDDTPFQVLVPDETRIPTGCRIIAQYAEGLNAQELQAQMSWGITDFITTANIHFFNQNGIQAPTNCRTSHQTAGEIIRLRNATGTAVTRSATVTAVAGGIEVTPIEASGLQHRFEVTLVFGSACFAFSQDGVGGSNTFDVIHGFATAPGAGMYGVCHPRESITNSVRVGFGYHADNGSGIVSSSLGFRRDNAANPTNGGIRNHNDKVASIAASNGAALDRVELTVNAPGTSTYTEISGVNGATIGLLIECDDIQTALVIEQTPTNDTLDWVVDSIGFRPQFVSKLLSQRIDSANGVSDATSGVHGHFSMDEEGSISSIILTQRDNVSSTLTRSALFDRLAFFDHNENQTHDLGPNFTFNDLGFVFDADDISLLDPVSRSYPILAFEGLIVPPPFPILTDPTDTAQTDTTALCAVTVNVVSGSVFMVVTQSAVTPTHAQIVAGQDELGAPADFALEEFTDSGLEGDNVNEFAPATGLIPETQYFTHFTQIDEELNETVPVSADGFMTTETNLAPIVDTPIPDQECTIGTPFGPLDVSGNFSDPNGDPLVFSQQGLPVGLTISSAGVISGTPRGGYQIINPSHIMNTGNAGVRVGFVAGNYGTLEPDTFGGETINTIITINDSDELVIAFSTENVPEDIWGTIAFQGDFGDGVELLQWDRIDDGFVYDPTPGGDLTSWRAPRPTDVKFFTDPEEYLMIITRQAVIFR